MLLKKINLFLILAVVLIINNFSFAQSTGNRQTSSIEGKILDLNTSAPLEFANVVLFSLADSTQITGTATDKSGGFVLQGIKPGNYFLRISFIGYDNSNVNRVEVKNTSSVNLGKIFLVPKEIGMKDIVVNSDRAPISYEIDKKVINVAKNFSASSGTAVDILENVPSITVDIEGNVSLRGSGNFKVLIDGQPSILDPSDALEQIPASAIENIEIITNPSAKYDPEGTAGVINIIMKKSQGQGLSGVMELNGGLKDKYGGEMIGDLKSQSFQSNIGVNYNKRTFGGSENENNWTNDGTTTSYYNSDGSSTRGMKNYGARASFSFDLGNKNTLSLGGRYNNRSHFGSSSLDYSEWTSANLSPEYYINNTSENRSGDNYIVFANYMLPFETKGHQLSAEMTFNYSNSESENINRLFNLTGISSGSISTEKGPDKELETKIDYTLPFNDDTKFEAGFQSELSSENEISASSVYNTSTGQFEIDHLYDNDGLYKTSEVALYSLFSSKYEKLGYQFGFRTEYTGRSIDVAETDTDFKINRWDYFPSAHLSYEFLAGHQVITSYTRRINRPRGWQLEPNKTWQDAYDIRVGNPSLLPEYIDSYEFGYQTFFGKSVLSLDAYYRATNNRIENIESVYSEKVTLHSFENIGKDYSLGTELFFNFDPIEKWNVNLMGNIYDYRIKGMLYGEDFSKNSFNWSARFNNTITVSSSTQIQLNAFYNSPTVSAQGRREGFLFTNLALKQELFDKFLTATLQVRDVFGSAKFESVSESSDFYSYRHMERDSPIVMLNLKFNLNNYKSHDNNRDSQSDMSEGVE
jgi:outer membrane receptor protein involved in Fe transport